MIKTTYELVTDQPPAMDWKSYAETLSRDWQQLLDSDECREAAFQDFLEQNPCLVPTAWATFREGHHSPFPLAVVAQPCLPGLGSRRPDFLWIASDSECVYAILIEIESPCRPWFTADGNLRHEMTHAMGQLKEWKSWFSLPHNVEQFEHDYRIRDGRLQHRTFIQRYVLITGRRRDIRDDHNRLRSRWQSPDELFMTYDRLAPDPRLASVMTVGLDAQGYFAKFVPPTVTIGPHSAQQHSLIRDRANAASRTNAMPPARAAFLAERWPYWDDWAKRHANFGARAGDCE